MLDGPAGPLERHQRHSERDRCHNRHDCTNTLLDQVCAAGSRMVLYVPIRNLRKGARRVKYMTVAEVAEELRVDQRTIRNWIRDGRLVAIRVGRQWRIERSEYDRFIERKEHPQDRMINALAFAR